MKIFFCKLRDALGFHITPTTEQPKGRCVCALGLRSWAPGTSFAEKNGSPELAPERWVFLAGTGGGGGVAVGATRPKQRPTLLSGAVKWRHSQAVCLAALGFWLHDTPLKHGLGTTECEACQCIPSKEAHCLKHPSLRPLCCTPVPVSATHPSPVPLPYLLSSHLLSLERPKVVRNVVPFVGC